eukprot:GHVO01027691.1.p1 GENE.GHVO01027691.1~~GHVO01027691.1.p1  ORF type:complete len:275 (+),score=41.55 GHVO01027691.1:13-837(+)
MFIIWERLQYVLAANGVSVKRADPNMVLESLQSLPKTKPHFITKRLSELLSGILTIVRGTTDETRVVIMVKELCGNYEELIRNMAQSRILLNVRDRLILVIDNLDLILTVLSQNEHSSHGIYERFESTFRDHVSAFVDSQLEVSFGDLIKFVKMAEGAIEDQKTGDHSPDQKVMSTFAHVPRGVNLNKMEQLVRHFSCTWKLSIQSLHGSSVSSFSNPDNGTEILKQTLTQLLLYHTRLKQIMGVCFPTQSQPPWVKELVPNATILAEIRKYSR